MGHCISYATFDKTTDKTRIFDECNERAAMNGDYGNGLPNSIRYYDNVCNNREEAEAFIKSHDKNWYDNLAVLYKEGTLSPTKTREKLLAKLNEAETKYNELNRSPHFATVKSAFIACKYCKSKIATDYMRKTNECPVCAYDMRPDTVKQKIEQYKNKVNETRKAVRDYDNEQTQKNYKLKWLVKYEYHC